MDTTRPSTSEDPEPRDAGTPDPEAESAQRESSGSANAWDQESESFGAWLSRNRRVRGIELREIAEDSKIGMTYLRAFEDDRFDILPASVFAKGFLRQYANYVGLDPEEVVNFYISAARRSGESVEEGFESEDESSRRDSAKLFALAIGTVMVVLLLIWLMTRGEGVAPSEATSSEVATSGESRPAPVATPTVAANEPSADASSAAVSSAAAANAPEFVPPIELAPIRLTLDFSGECWVELAVDGERRLAENKVQGESLVLQAQEEIELKVGDVSVVEAELNDLPFDLGPVRGTKVRNLRIDLDTVASFGDRPEGES